MLLCSELSFLYNTAPSNSPITSTTLDVWPKIAVKIFKSIYNAA